MKTVVVSGVIANKLHNGGAAWTRLSWARGLARLGYRVVFVEQISDAACVDDDGNHCTFRQSTNLRHFERVTREFGLAESGALMCEETRDLAGMTWDELQWALTEADFLLNISGHLSVPDLFLRAQKRVYVDVDPGYTQHWHAMGHLPHLEAHTHFFSVGVNIGKSFCTIPTNGIDWQPTLQPVVLSDWPMQAADADRPRRFTTIASWRGPFGPIETAQQRLGAKVHEFRKYADLPRQLQRLGSRLAVEMELALQIDSADEKDRAILENGGWRLADPRVVAGTPAVFRQYVQRSSAEFSVAQGIYVHTASGWFSDRSTRYLATGRPVIVQDTHLSDVLPIGDGLLTFDTPESAIDAIERVCEHCNHHCQSARRLAEMHFDSNKVIQALIDRLG